MKSKAFLFPFILKEEKGDGQRETITDITNDFEIVEISNVEINR